MIKIPALDLPDTAQRALTNLQGQIDAFPVYAERVKEARDRFEAENRVGNATFDIVRNTLSSMSAGFCRCMYCEDSAASEIEHFRPKTFYPDAVFVWLNYLYACGPCNRIKRSHFRLLLPSSDYMDLRRARRAAAIEPPSGSSVLIDPRAENPLKYMSIDLKDTFWFVSRDPKGSPEYVRAEYTITRLKLNERDFLPKARESAYLKYRALLKDYIDVRGTLEADRVRAAILRCDHPSVWAHMKDQAAVLPDLQPLFISAPEARGW